MRVKNCNTNNNDWKRWCRICSKENGNQVNVFVKSEDSCSLIDIIQNMLSITISTSDEAPTNICLWCNELLKGLIIFCTQSIKVQEMYSEITICEKFEPITDFELLREKYGLKCTNALFKFNQKEIDNEFDMQLDLKCINTNTLDVNTSSQQIIKKKKKQHGLKRNFKKTEIDIIEPIDENQNIKSADSCPKKSKKDDFLQNHETNQNESVVLQLENVNCSLKDKKENTKLEKVNYSLKDKKENTQYDTKVKKIHCEHCVRTFVSKKGLTFHMKSYHPVTGDALKFPCSTCGRAFNNITTLKNHLNMHLPREARRFYCPHCDDEFNSRSVISFHIRRQHQKIKPFICEECGKTFHFRGQLVSHKIIHSEERDFQCKKCSKKFKSMPQLKVHYDIHEDTKYKCPVCETLLNTKAILRRHMVIHSDVQKYKCNFCDKSFKRSKTLKEHLILHTGLKPYQCPFCDLTFTHGSNSRKHQKQSHPIELARMEERGEKQPCKNLPRLETLKAANAAAMNALNTFNNSSSTTTIPIIHPKIKNDPDQ